MTLGQKLKQTRLARGMTQSQVVGDRITRNMLSQIENDLASPSVGTLEYLASVLNVRLSWLLADEQEEAEAGRTQRRLQGVLLLSNGISHLRGGFTLRCLQRLSLPDLATRP